MKKTWKKSIITVYKSINYKYPSFLRTIHREQSAFGVRRPQTTRNGANGCGGWSHNIWWPPLVHRCLAGAGLGPCGRLCPGLLFALVLFLLLLLPLFSVLSHEDGSEKEKVGEKGRRRIHVVQKRRPSKGRLRRQMRARQPGGR